MNGPISKSMELPSEFVSDFVSSVIAEVNRRVMKYDREISAAYSELYLLGRGYGGRDIIMSKVKGYIDINIEKARHRNRIDETKRIKANRIRKCKNDAYRWTRGGYYHETERVVDVLRSPNGRIIKTFPVSILRKGLPRWLNSSRRRLREDTEEAEKT